MANLTHIDKSGAAHMVDVSAKADTVRTATAQASVRCSEAVFEQLESDANPKGDVFATVRIAGIQAAKQCSQLIPLCHPLPLHKVSVEITLEKPMVVIRAKCKTTGKTGIEMEALTAASVSALTLYDMCKAIDKGLVIEHIRLLEKTGGKSGDWHAG